MKVFDFISPNFLVNKTYKVHQKDESTLIQVSSPFLGNWEFELKSINHDLICLGLQRYMSGEYIQDCFPNLTVEQRERFITPPSMWLNV